MVGPRMPEAVRCQSAEPWKVVKDDCPASPIAEMRMTASRWLEFFSIRQLTMSASI